MFRQRMVGWLKYLARPDTSTFQYHFRRICFFPWQHVLPLLEFLFVSLETGYPFFIWSKTTRLIWLIGICGMHLRDWFYRWGMFLFRAGHDHFECCRVRHGFHPRVFQSASEVARRRLGHTHLSASTAAQSERTCRSV